MKRIVVATSHPLFASGGHLVIANALVKALSDCGYDASLLLTPQNRFGRQGSAYLATWLTDVAQAYDSRNVDQVISLRFPSYALQHSRHVCWLNHRMREYYDQWSWFARQLSWPSWIKEGLRRGVIHTVDRYLLTDSVSRVCAQSKTIQSRLMKWGSITSEVVYPPAPPRPYRCEKYGDYLLVPSRLTTLKRVDMVLDALLEPEAMAVRCVIVGDGDQRTALAARVAEYGLSGRVTMTGHVSDSTLVDYFGKCRAVCVPAVDEDYGLVTVESFASAKPVITCSDSGGPSELVASEENGLVVRPESSELAKAIGRMMDDVDLAEQCGQVAYQQSKSMTWEQTVRQLVLV